jgi:hypothetical protein
MSKAQKLIDECLEIIHELEENIKARDEKLKMYAEEIMRLTEIIDKSYTYNSTVGDDE